MRKFYLIKTEGELEKITGLTNQELWDAGVCLDDYDYFIATPTSEEISKSRAMEFDLKPKDDLWEKMLTGCCYDKWYYLKTPNGNFFIGGAYHS